VPHWEHTWITGPA